MGTAVSRTMVSEYFVLPLTYVQRKILKPSRCKGEGEGGVGRSGKLTEGQNPNYDSAQFTKASNINEIQRFC